MYSNWYSIKTEGDDPYMFGDFSLHYVKKLLTWMKSDVMEVLLLPKFQYFLSDMSFKVIKTQLILSHTLQIVLLSDR